MKVSRVSGVLLLSLLACSAPGASLSGPGFLTPGSPSTHAVSDEERWEFWTAVAALDLRGAERRAPDREHRRFVRAMRQVLDGRMGDAETPLAELATGAADTLLRSVSHVVLSAALEYQGKWAELDEFARGADLSILPAGQERAALVTWAAAMRRAPAVEYHFPAQPVTLPFLPAVTGTPTIVVRVNGHPLRFWVDTGSSITLIASDVAERVGVVPLSPDTLHMVTAVGVTRAQPAAVSRLELGALSISGQTAAIIPAEELMLRVEGQAGEAARSVKIDGVVGMDVVRRLDLRIDFFRGRMTLARPRPGRAGKGGRNLLWLGYPLVRLEQPDGRPLYFGLDTGADRTYATEALLGKLPRRWLRKQRQRVAGFGSDTTLTVPTLPTLNVRIGERNFVLTELSVHAPRRLGFVQLDGVLGTDTAAGLVMRIDMTNGVFEISFQL